MRIGVLADDLSGAGDVALALEKAGFRTEISLWPPSCPPPPGFAWVISTESRPLPAAAAKARVRAAAARLRRWKAAFVFKKIDSTLRGPVGAELEGFLAGLGWGGDALTVVAASPALGRTTRDGRHFVDGAPLHRTAFGRDPRHPMRTNRVADLLGGRVSRWRLPDVLEKKDLDRVARVVAAEGSRAAAGSAGFAEALARRWPAGRRGKQISRPGGKTAPSPVLLVSGSAHPVSHGQAAALKRLLPLGVEVLEAPTRRGHPARVTSDLIRRAAAAVRRSGAARFAVTGGETAAALARNMGVRRWRVAAALGPGIPLCASVGARRRTWWAVKPGGFGTEDVWKRVINRLART